MQEPQWGRWEGAPRMGKEACLTGLWGARTSPNSLHTWVHPGLTPRFKVTALRRPTAGGDEKHRQRVLLLACLRLLLHPYPPALHPLSWGRRTQTRIILGPGSLWVLAFWDKD